MKILHLFSDWTWTGPAEPVLNLCKGPEKRGRDVTLAYRKPPYPIEDNLEKRILREGVKATHQFHLNHVLKLSKPGFFWDVLCDLSRLTQYLRQERFDILNVHHSHDHILGGLAARRTNPPVIVLRTDHKRDSIKSNVGNRLLMSRLTDGIRAFSEKSRREDIEHFKLPPERVGKIPPALDGGKDWKVEKALAFRT